jgi:fructokinase
LENLFGISDPERIYKREIEFYCKNFICTDASGDIILQTSNVKSSYKVNKIDTVSTIGAGDNFNAGVVYGIIQNGIGREGLSGLSELEWNRIIHCGIDLASDVCKSLNNSISKEFAKGYNS